MTDRELHLAEALLFIFPTATVLRLPQRFLAAAGLSLIAALLALSMPYERTQVGVLKLASDHLGGPVLDSRLLAIQELEEAAIGLAKLDQLFADAEGNGRLESGALDWSTTLQRRANWASTELEAVLWEKHEAEFALASEVGFNNCEVAPRGGLTYGLEDVRCAGPRVSGGLYLAIASLFAGLGFASILVWALNIYHVAPFLPWKGGTLWHLGVCFLGVLVMFLPAAVFEFLYDLRLSRYVADTRQWSLSLGVWPVVLLWLSTTLSWSIRSNGILALAKSYGGTIALLASALFVFSSELDVATGAALIGTLWMPLLAWTIHHLRRAVGYQFRFFMGSLKYLIGSSVLLTFGWLLPFTGWYWPGYSGSMRVLEWLVIPVLLWQYIILRWVDVDVVVTPAPQ